MNYSHQIAPNEKRFHGLFKYKTAVNQLLATCEQIYFLQQ